MKDTKNGTSKILVPSIDWRFRMDIYNRWDGELIRLWLSASQYEAGVKPMIYKKNYDNFSKRIGEPLYGIKLAMKDGNVIDIPCYYLKMEGLQYKKDESEQTVRFAEQLMSMLH